jgi:hypothetical protein
MKSLQRSWNMRTAIDNRGSADDDPEESGMREHYPPPPTQVFMKSLRCGPTTF